MRCSSEQEKKKLVAEKCRYNIFCNEIIYGEEKMKTREDKRMAENGRTWYIVIFFENLPFLRHIFRKATHSLLGAWSFLLVHIQSTPSEGPKDFIN